VIRVRPQKTTAHQELFAGVAHLLDRELDRLHRKHRHPEQTVRLWPAVISGSTGGGTAHRCGEFRAFHRAGELVEARAQESGVNSVRAISTMRACGSTPPFRSSAYLRLSSLTEPAAHPTAPRLPIPRGLPSNLPSTLKRSLRFRRSRVAGGGRRIWDRSHRSTRSDGARRHRRHCKRGSSAFPPG
jgi:hypothetical protein